jgi:hypothetical protein
VPAHALPLDAVLIAVSLLMAWKLRARLVLVFLAIVPVHALGVAGVIPTPRSTLEWGALTLGLGFFLLFGSLAVSHRAQRRALLSFP